MAGMKFGFTLPYGGARTAAELAQLGEECGWDGCFLGDAIWTQDPMVALAAAAMVTRQIRLGIMVVPVPLRRPWKIASESVAVDHLSDGRLILGMGTGAVWMGWQGFPDEETDVRKRAEMLDETIEIVTLLYQRKPFDYAGKHYHLKLTLVDEIHYPPKPIQQPRIPLWVVGVWPRMKSMRRVLICDGLLPLKMSIDGKFEEVTPDDLRQMKAYLDANRKLDTPFDLVVEGKTMGLGHDEVKGKLSPWVDAGATWWIEGLWENSEAEVRARILDGPPKFV